MLNIVLFWLLSWGISIPFPGGYRYCCVEVSGTDYIRMAAARLQMAHTSREVDIMDFCVCVRMLRAVTRISLVEKTTAALCVS